MTPLVRRLLPLPLFKECLSHVLSNEIERKGVTGIKEEQKATAVRKAPPGVSLSAGSTAFTLQHGTLWKLFWTNGRWIHPPRPHTGRFVGTELQFVYTWAHLMII